MTMDMDDPSLTAWLTIVRALHMGSCLLIAGVWFIDCVIVARSAAGWRRIALLLLGVATPVALVSGFAWLVLVTANMCDLPMGQAFHRLDQMRLVWTHTRFGRTWQLHGLFWLGSATVNFLGRRFRRPNWIGLMLGTALIAGLAWAGHGDTGPAPVWHRAADLLHLAASAVWPAGLVPFFLILISLSRSGDLISIHQLTHRFSAASLIAVGVLTASGLVSSWCLLGSWGALIHTWYGRVLAIKVAVFAGMILLGAINLLALKPRLVTDELNAGKMRRNVLFEIILATIVMLVVGLLGVLEPARM